MNAQRKRVHSTMDVEYEGVTWTGEWVSYVREDGSEAVDHWLVIVDADGNEIPYGLKPQVTSLLVEKRIQELQAEYGINSENKDNLGIAESILGRVWSYEWMGQTNSSYEFYVQNLAKLLDIEFQEAHQLVYQLSLQKKAGLNGFILIPWDKMEAARAQNENFTGHKELNQSDFGGWACHHCKNSADEHGPDPSSVPCIPNQSHIDTEDYLEMLIKLTEAKRNKEGGSAVLTQEERLAALTELIEKKKNESE